MKGDWRVETSPPTGFSRREQQADADTRQLKETSAPDSRSDTSPLLPSQSAAVLADLACDEIGSNIYCRALLEINALSSAAEVFASEVSHFFGTRMGDARGSLEELQGH